PLDGRAGRCDDHGARGLARDHGLAARCSRRGDHAGRRGCRCGGVNGSFGALRQVDAGALDVGYVDAGPGGGPPVGLLHGWPYDIHSFAEVAPVLTEAGRRVIVPYLRGYGTTRFLSDSTLRNGEQAALAVDVIALMDALEIETAILGGFDWGAR